MLVSEWMGNCLLFEFMVESVLLARDRWLREGGVMWPSSAALTLVPCQADSYYAEKMAFWERPYGLDFTPLQSSVTDPPAAQAATNWGICISAFGTAGVLHQAQVQPPH